MLSPEQFKKHKESLKNKKIFSKYYQGIRLNDVMRYSVTKELIANKIAEIVWNKGYRDVVDACGGAGGNTIAFARKGMNVACVELNQENIEDSMNNCEVYQVTDNVYFHLGDALEFDCLNDAGLDPTTTFFFISCEWGGPSYREQEVFNLENLNPPLSETLDYIKRMGYPEAAFYIPRNSDREQAQQAGCVKFEYMYIDGWCDAACLWFDFTET